MRNSEIPNIDAPKWYEIFKKVIPKEQDSSVELINVSGTDVYIASALQLCKINPENYSKDQSELAFSSLCTFIEERMSNGDFEISNFFKKDIKEIPAGENILADMLVNREPISKLNIGRSFLNTMDTYSQSASENRANFEQWKPIIEKQLAFYEDGIQVIDKNQD